MFFGFAYQGSGGTGSGLTATQDARLTLILNLLEADEVFDAETGVAQKLLKGTNTVLLEKAVNGTTCVDHVELLTPVAEEEAGEETGEE